MCYHLSGNEASSLFASEAPWGPLPLPCFPAFIVDGSIPASTVLSSVTEGPPTITLYPHVHCFLGGINPMPIRKTALFNKAQMYIVGRNSSYMCCVVLTQARHPLMPDDSMAELLRRHLKGSLPEDLWKEVVQGFCRPKVLSLPWSPFLGTAFVSW